MSRAGTLQADGRAGREAEARGAGQGHAAGAWPDALAGPVGASCSQFGF